MNEFERQVGDWHHEQEQAYLSGDQKAFAEASEALDYVVSERNPNFTRERLTELQESFMRRPATDLQPELTEIEKVAYPNLVFQWSVILDRDNNADIYEETAPALVESLLSVGIELDRAAELCRFSFMEAQMEQTK